MRSVCIESCKMHYSSALCNIWDGEFLNPGRTINGATKCVQSQGTIILKLTYSVCSVIIMGNPLFLHKKYTLDVKSLYWIFGTTDNRPRMARWYSG